MAKKETDLGRINGRQLAVSRTGTIVDNAYISQSRVDDDVKLYKGDLIIMSSIGVLVELQASPYDEDFNPDDWKYSNMYVVGNTTNLKGPQGAKGEQGEPGQMDIVLGQERDTGDTLDGKKKYIVKEDKLYVLKVI